MADIRVKGINEIRKKLKSLPNDLADKALQSAVTASAKEFVQDARSRAPVDSGDLGKSIKVRKTKTKSRYKKAASVRPRKGSGLDPYYWWFVELGTVKQSPQPFLRPAFDGNVEQAAEKFKAALQRGLRRYAK